MLTLALALLAGLLLLASAAMWITRPRGRAIEGGAAPDFALPDQDGRIRRLGDYAGCWLVLYFYPRDDTPHCTREACALRDAWATLAKRDAAVLGVSVDSVARHADFAHKYALPFPLLSDARGRIAMAYGSVLDFGVARLARRNTFIIAPDGRIAARFDAVDAATHADTVMRTLDTLRRGWVPGLTPSATPAERDASSRSPGR